MIQELQLRILPEEAVNEQSLKQVVAHETGAQPKDIQAVRVLKRSIDARQRTIYVNVKLRVFINEQPEEPEYQSVEYKDVSGGKQVVVVGAGPGGLFAALRLIELGLRPVIIERGKNVRERKKDIALISREHTVNSESNYSFGEGGAGAYSGWIIIYPQQETRFGRQDIKCFFASTERVPLFWPMPIRISVRTSSPG